MTTDPADDLARRLFEAARSEPLPRGAEKRVVEAALKARDARRKSSLGRVAAYVSLAALLLSVVVFMRRHDSAIAIGAEPANPASTPPGTPIVPEPASAAVPPSQEEPRPSVPVPAVRPTPRATLADEIDALNRAESALGASDPIAALKALDLYDHVLKGTQMRAEATVLRIEALQRTGNGRAATDLARRFVRENPGSPLVDRARSFLATRAATDGGTP